MSVDMMFVYCKFRVSLLRLLMQSFCIVQVGVERMHKDSKYVLFLDDDVRLHPGSIGALTAEMEKNPEVC